MIKLKNFFAPALIIIALYYLGTTFYRYYIAPCDRPLEYSIGQFDTQFGVSVEEFKLKLAMAEVPWEKASQKELFKYVEGGDFKINLIFDSRQSETVQKQRLESGLTATEEFFKKVDNDFNNLKAAYDLAVSSYQTSVQNFENKRRAYEKRVEYWNAKGGAPEGQYEALQEEAKLLNAEVERLNKESANLNIKTEELNALLQKRNEAAAEYNQVAKRYNQEYGHGLEFNQAEYVSGKTRLLSLERRDGGQINVYQFGSENDLLLALSHEFGHSLGMDHTENPKSIMYYSTNEGESVNVVPTAEDLAELKRVCKI